MRTIRYGCFETNSSSMHSFIYMNKEDLDKFNNKDGLIVGENEDDSPEYHADYTRYPSISEYFSFEKLYEESKDMVESKIQYYHFDIWNNWKPLDMFEVEKGVEFIKKNYSVELLKYAYDSSYTNDKFSKFPKGILRSFIDILFSRIFDNYFISFDDFTDRDWKIKNFELKDNKITDVTPCATDENVVYLSGKLQD